MISIDGCGPFLNAVVGHVLSGEAKKLHQAWIKLAAAATGIKGLGQENDLGDHYRSHKRKVKQYDSMYFNLAGAETPLDPNLQRNSQLIAHA